jgi:hypothetical protein
MRKKHLNTVFLKKLQITNYNAHLNIIEVSPEVTCVDNTRVVRLKKNRKFYFRSAKRLTEVLKRHFKVQLLEHFKVLDRPLSQSFQDKLSWLVNPEPFALYRVHLAQM